MSATNRGAIRSPHDFYRTPSWVIRRFLESIDLPGGAWIEPCAGDGAIIRAVNDARADVSWSAVEVREECETELRGLVAPHDIVMIGDFLAHAPSVPHNVAILNPPFSQAHEFICRCLGMASWVCALERLNFLEGEKRNEWLRSEPPDVYVLPNRPSFTGEGSDSIAYAWFVWPPHRKRLAGALRVLPTTPTAARDRVKLVLPDGVGAEAQGRLL